MPGIKPQLLIAIPSIGLVRMEFLMAMIANRGAMHIGMPCSYGYTIGRPYPQCHEELADIAVNQDFKYILFVEDDILLPPNAILKLVKADKDVITGIYWDRRTGDDSHILVSKNYGELLDLDKEEEIFEIDNAGIGCVLIKTEVLRNIAKPWFDVGVIDDIVTSTSDVWFYHKLKKAGYKAYAHKGVQCGHIDGDTGRIYPSDWKLKF